VGDVPAGSLSTKTFSAIKGGGGSTTGNNNRFGYVRLTNINTLFPVTFDIVSGNKRDVVGKADVSVNRNGDIEVTNSVKNNIA
jgi:methionine salvage enolase-phosphatase E1